MDSAADLRGRERGSGRDAFCATGEGSPEHPDLVLCRCAGSDAESEDAVEKTAKILGRRLEAFYADLTASPNATSLFPFTFAYHRLRTSKETIMEGFMACPGHTVQLAPIRMKSVLDTPLASSLRSEMRSSKERRPQAGYLSMDTCRRLIPLLSDDAHVRSMTLVGVWLSGLSDILHPSTLAACLRFHETSSVRDKVIVDGAFLVLFYENGAYAAKLYECRIESERTERKLLFYSCRVLGRKTSESGDVKIKWKLETTKANVLAALQDLFPAPPEDIKNSCAPQRPIRGQELSESSPCGYAVPRETRLKRTRNGDHIPLAHQSAKKEKDLAKTSATLSHVPRGSLEPLVREPTLQHFVIDDLSFCPSQEGDQEDVSDQLHLQMPLSNAKGKSSWTFLGFHTDNSMGSSNETSSDLQIVAAAEEREALMTKEACCQTVESQEEATSRQVELDQEVQDLKNKVSSWFTSRQGAVVLQVALLEEQIERLLKNRHEHVQWTAPSSALSSVFSTPTDHKRDAFALVPVNGVSHTTMDQPKAQERFPDPPVICEASLPSSHVSLNPLENETATMANLSSLDISIPFLSTSFMDLPLPDFDEHDSELEMLSRKYLGTREFSSHVNRVN